MTGWLIISRLSSFQESKRAGFRGSARACGVQLVKAGPSASHHRMHPVHGNDFPDGCMHARRKHTPVQAAAGRTPPHPLKPAHLSQSSRAHSTPHLNLQRAGLTASTPPTLPPFPATPPHSAWPTATPPPSHISSAFRHASPPAAPCPVLPLSVAPAVLCVRRMGRRPPHHTPAPRSSFLRTACGRTRPPFLLSVPHDPCSLLTTPPAASASG